MERISKNTNRIDKAKKAGQPARLVLAVLCQVTDGLPVRT
jgi:hypothetical protein